MKLEDLVPPLGLCKQIPAGCFEDSALVWWDETLYFRRDVDFLSATPAPTPAEILMELPKHCDKSAFALHFMNDDNPAASALKLWLEVSK